MVSSLPRVLAAACGLDGVEVADQVGNRDVGRGQFFDVAVSRER